MLLAALVVLPQPAQAQTASVTGVNGIVYAVAMDSAGNIYAGGQFTLAGGSPAANIAVYNGASWQSLGAGLNGVVNDLALDSSGRVFAGGNFTTAGGAPANRVAMWNPATQTWSALGQGTDAVVNAVAVDGTDLYVAGDFLNVGAAPIRRLARYSISTGAWTALGTGANGAVRDLLVNGRKLYIAGNFSRINNQNIQKFGVYNPATGAFSTPGIVNGNVLALAADPYGNIYLGGSFTIAGGLVANNVVRYVPSVNAWAILGGASNNGVNSTVRGLAWKDNMLYAGGQFTMAGRVSAANVAMWNGVTWAPMGAGTDGTVYALVADDVVAGGSFLNADGILVNYIALWDGVSWKDLTNQPTPVVLADLTASQAAGGIMLGWTTAFEYDVVGFNILRAGPDGVYTPMNSELILSQAFAQVVGSSYEFLDTTVKPGVYYQYILEVVNVNGAPESYGPVGAKLRKR